MNANRRLPLLSCLALLLGLAAACGQPSPTGAPLSPVPTPAPTPLSSVPFLVAPGWEEVRVQQICLQVRQTAPQDTPVYAPQVRERIYALMELAGLQPMLEGAACQAVLTLDLLLEPLPAEYPSLGTCYSGARISGQVILKPQGRGPLTVPLDLELAPPATLEEEDCRPRSTGAPYGELVDAVVVEALAELWGRPVLERAGELRGTYPGLYEAAQERLKEIP
ncbi:MAG: hypothetical protein JXA37_13130 [Chloroflexia bacterium]|nr:hypothetical protein [Chloroflexia bacterium]